MMLTIIMITRRVPEGPHEPGTVHQNINLRSCELGQLDLKMTYE